VNCQESERGALTFLAAGTLDEPERAAVIAHLEGCPACQAEWPGVRRLVEGLRELHLTPQQVIDAAVSGAHGDHLRLCGRCRDEVETLRLVDRDLARSRPKVALAWKLAASLAVGAGAGLLLRPELLPEASPAAAARAAADVRRIEELERRLDELERPQPNVPLVELQPDSLRGGQAGVVSLRRAQGRALLVLASLDERRFDDYVVEVVAPAGTALFRGAGLARTPQGTFSLELPLARLLPGPYQILLFGVAAGREHRLERFEIRIE
jgi:anti-sigma factor RsiW